jgi:hypothetical protein
MGEVKRTVDPSNSSNSASRSIAFTVNFFISFSFENRGH